MTTATVTAITPAEERQDEDDAWIEALRGQVRTIMAAEGLSQADIATDSGIAYGTFTGWLSGKYQGRNDRVAAQVQV